MRSGGKSFVNGFKRSRCPASSIAAPIVLVREGFSEMSPVGRWRASGAIRSKACGEESGRGLTDGSRKKMMLYRPCFRHADRAAPPLIDTVRA